MKTSTTLALTALFVSQSALAAPVTVGGLNVDFTFDELLLGLYGMPTILDNSIYFTPVDFDVTSLNGSGFSISNATANIKVTPKAGFDLDSVALTESGDYALLGMGAEVFVTGQLRVFDLAAPAVLSTTSIVSTLMTTTGLPTVDWSASASTNLDTSAWLPGGGINLTIENILLASTTTSPSLAFIEKKFVGASFTVSALPTPVPETSNRALMLVGAGLIAFVVRRRARP